MPNLTRVRGVRDDRGHLGGQVGARGVAGEHHAVHVGVQSPRVGPQVRVCVVQLTDRRRVGGPRRQRIVDADHGEAPRGDELEVRRVVGLVPRQPGAAVCPDDDRERGAGPDAGGEVHVQERVSVSGTVGLVGDDRDRSRRDMPLHGLAHVRAVPVEHRADDERARPGTHPERDERDRDEPEHCARDPRRPPPAVRALLRARSRLSRHPLPRPPRSTSSHNGE